MKNQNDLIVAGAVVFVSIGVAMLFFFTQRDPQPFSEPVSVVTSDAPQPAASVVMAESLPGGSTQQGGGAGGGARGGIAGLGGSGGPQIGGDSGGGRGISERAR